MVDWYFYGFLGAVIVGIMGFSFWMYLFFKRLPGMVDTLKSYFADREKDFEERVFKKLDERIEKIVPKEGGLTSKIESGMFNAIKNLTDPQNKQGKEAFDVIKSEAYNQSMSAIESVLIGIKDPQDKDAEEFIGGLITSVVYTGWHAIMNDKTMKNSVRGYLDDKIEYAIEHLIKRIAEDPDLLSKVISSYQEGGGGEATDPLTAMFGGMFGGLKLLPK